MLTAEHHTRMKKYAFVLRLQEKNNDEDLSFTKCCHTLIHPQCAIELLLSRTVMFIKQSLTKDDCSIALAMKSRAHISSGRQKKILRSHVILRARLCRPFTVVYTELKYYLRHIFNDKKCIVMGVFF